MVLRNIQRVFVLLSCTFLGLICGTLYLYSSYSPQLAKQLQYTASDSSLIALCGTIGVAIAGPLSGAVVDKKGYTYSLLVGGMLIVSGYIGMKFQYDLKWNNLLLSCYWIFSIGLGSTFITSACLKCCAVSFPSIRGVATSLPLALYGLSALFYSVIASAFYSERTSDFLEFLARSIVIIFVACFPSVYMADKDHKKKASLQSKRGPKSLDNANHTSLRRRLFFSLKFWLIFIITGILAALGQMYIYSVGYIVKALVVSETDPSPTLALNVDILIQQQQQVQVGLLSIANCLGRITSGIMGDIITQSFNKPRSWLLIIPASGTLVAQLLSSAVHHYSSLSLNSFLIGYVYGFMFCLMPIIVGDVFGMDNFSFNWGMVTLAPIIPSYYFTSLFGKIYDANSSLGSAVENILNVDPDAGTTVTAKIQGCFLGNQCYNEIFGLTTTIAAVAIFLVVILNASDLLFKRKKLLSLLEIRADNFASEKPK